MRRLLLALLMPLLALQALAAGGSDIDPPSTGSWCS